MPKASIHNLRHMVNCDMLKKHVQRDMADWMQDQTEADRKLLERLKALRDDARKAYNAERLRQKAKYEQRRRREARAKRDKDHPHG
jgi:Tfp pilus assembly protein PilP